MQPMLTVLLEAAAGRFPAPEGGVSVVTTDGRAGDVLPFGRVRRLGSEVHIRRPGDPPLSEHHPAGV